MTAASASSGDSGGGARLHSSDGGDLPPPSRERALAHVQAQEYARAPLLPPVGARHRHDGDGDGDGDALRHGSDGGDTCLGSLQKKCGIGLGHAFDAGAMIRAALIAWPD